MNTVDIGESYELLVYKKFKQLLDSEDLYVNKNRSEVKYKPSYFSKQRNSDIRFDVSIETFNKELNEISLLTIIECKKYSGLVPVDDIEEFISKIDQVSGKNVKGILCSNNGFQKSTIEVAKYNNIALVRLSSIENLSWDLPRTRTINQYTTEINNRIFNTLTDDNVKIPPGFFAAKYNYLFTYSSIELIEQITNIHIKKSNQPPYKNQTYNIPFITEELIKNKIEEEFKKRNIIINNERYYSSFSSFIKSIKNDIEIIDNCDLGYDYLNNLIIGKYSSNTIYTTDKFNFNNYRFNFTLAHEIAHYFLHSKEDWYLDFINNFNDVTINNISKITLSESLNKIERQANIFASELLVPDHLFIKIMKDIIRYENLVDKGYGYIYLDHQKVNRSLLNKIIIQLRQHFKASDKVFEIKLRKHKFLKLSYDFHSKFIRYIQDMYELNL